MKIEVDIELLPPGRPSISLALLLAKRDHSTTGANPCVCVSIEQPITENRDALLNGMRKILPFIYHAPTEAIKILFRYGVNVTSNIFTPPSPTFQWAHAGEILMCAYFEECENNVVLSYKWRLNTTRNQHQFGMDLLAFDLQTSPPVIKAIAVKTTHQGSNGKTPSVVYDAINELKEYLISEKLDDDLEVISANLHTDDVNKKIFKDWYDPYAQGVPSQRPQLIPVPAIVIDAQHWQDKYALPAIQHDFGMPGMVRILCIDELENLIQETYKGVSS